MPLFVTICTSEDFKRLHFEDVNVVLRGGQSTTLTSSKCYLDILKVSY